MAVYRLAVAGQGPLRMQLGAVPSNRLVKLLEVAAHGETTAGTSTSPVLSRPSTVGTGTNIFAQGADSTAVCPVIVTFSSAPSVPATGGSLPALPARKRIVFPPRSTPLVYPAAAILLYASVSGGHTWTDELTWEEL